MGPASQRSSFSVDPDATFLPKTGETDKKEKTSQPELDSLVREEMTKKIVAMRTVEVQLSDERAGRALNRHALPPAPPNPGSHCAIAMFCSTSVPKGDISNELTMGTFLTSLDR